MRTVRTAKGPRQEIVAPLGKAPVAGRMRGQFHIDWILHFLNTLVSKKSCYSGQESYPYEHSEPVIMPATTIHQRPKAGVTLPPASSVLNSEFVIVQTLFPPDLLTPVPARRPAPTRPVSQNGTFVQSVCVGSGAFQARANSRNFPEMVSSTFDRVRCFVRRSGSLEGWKSNIDGERNLFDVMRLIMAVLVILYHSYFLAPGVDCGTFSFCVFAGPYNFSSERIDLGGLAVYAFFVISGFLITKSWVRSTTWHSYAKRRLARIAPAYVGASLFAVFVLGPLTSGDPASYFSNQRWPVIVANFLSFRGTQLTGVLEGNPVGLVNGSLWTIKAEVDCYIMIALVGCWAAWRTPMRQTLIVAFLTVLALNLALRFGLFVPPQIGHTPLGFLISSPTSLLKVVPYFLSGSLFYFYREQIPRKFSLFLVSIAMMGVCLAMGDLDILFVLFYAYFILFTGSLGGCSITIFGKRADLSYGFYVYGWMVQQLLVHFSLPAIAPSHLFVLSVLCTLPLAWLSWTLVEAPCLALVHRKSRR
jgi:peptidoglycan/LPS O-acetylase OafA/YrhL